MTSKSKVNNREWQPDKPLKGRRKRGWLKKAKSEVSVDER